LIEHWASHGYVCIQPTHSDSIKLMKAARRRQLRSAEQFVRDPRTVANWAERPREIKAILDQLGTVAERAEGLGERMDRERIAVAGHSFGAHTTAMIAGLKLFGPGGRTITIADDRPTAALIISPQGLGRSIRPASWAAVDGPVMMITGSKDTSPRNNKSADWRLTAWKHLDPGDDRYLLFIEAAHHNFGGISGVRYPGAGPKNADHLAQVRSATTAYFDALLKSTDGEARVEAKREDARPADRP
jgi:pimeloyl-ACP methyl ester carboxylesterase